MKVGVLMVFCGISGIYAFHKKKWNKNNQLKDARYGVQPFIFDIMNNVGGLFDIKVPANFEVPKFNFRKLSPGQAQILNAGKSRGIIYRGRKGSSGGFAFSSGGGKGFSMVSDGSPAGNLLMSSNGKTDKVFMTRSKPLPIFGRNGFFSKLLRIF